MTLMFSGKARWFVVAGLCSSALLACSSDSPSEGDGGAGNPSGGSAAGNQSGGTSTTAGMANVAGSHSGSGQAGNTTAGSGSGGASGGTSAGTGGASSGSGGGGTGGASGGTGGASGGTGGGSAMPTAVANITGVNGKTVMGTATFTQGPTMTKLVLNLTACPNGAHVSHIHENKDCGNNGEAAGGHWMPNGVTLGDYTCADNKGTLEVTRPTTQWTVGAPDTTDVTKYAFMVHDGTEAAPGGKIGCGVINKQ
jgi:Cu/Zn superoxide dismutase